MEKASFCGVMLYGIAVSGFSLGIDYVSPITVSFIYAVAPFLTAGLMFIIYNKGLSRNKIIGLLLGTIGLLPILLLGEESGKRVRYMESVYFYFLCFCTVIHGFYLKIL